MNRTSLNQTKDTASELTAASNADQQLIDALSGLDAQSSLSVVRRTRHTVMAAAYQMRAAEIRRRRQAGIALMVFVALALFLTPAIWSVADDLFNGEHFQDTPAMTMSLIVTLFSTIFAALIVHLRSRKAHDGEES